MKKLSLFALLAFLAGCGNYFSVRVPYQFPDMPGVAAARLAARYAGRPMERFRPVFRKKGDKDSEEAGRLARRNGWAEAEEIWLRQGLGGRRAGNFLRGKRGEGQDP